MLSFPRVRSLLTLLAACAVSSGCFIEVHVDLDDPHDETAPAARVAPEAVEEAVIPAPPAPVEAELAPAPPRLLRIQPLPPRPGPLPPPERPEKDVAAEPTFTPFTVAPSILNRNEIVREMERAYPPLLRDAGIGGTARVWFLIDSDGTLLDTRLDVGSGHAALDIAAMRVAELYRFSPAKNRAEPVQVWVNFPITFQVR